MNAINRTNANHSAHGGNGGQATSRPTSQVYTTSIKGVQVMPNQMSASPDHPQPAVSKLAHCRSFDSTYAQLLGTCPPTHSSDHAQRPLLKSTSSSHLMHPNLRSRPDLAAGLTIDSHARQRSDKYLKTVRKSARQKSRQERIARLDDAIFELEQMYHQLRLNDEELLDRAERRDLPTHVQLLRYQTGDDHAHQSPTKKMDSPKKMNGSSNESLTDSHTGPLTMLKNRQSPAAHAHLIHNRTPPMRRSAVPDLISDDLAVRRLQPNALQNSRSTGDLLDRHPSRSYMSQCLAYDERSLPTTPTPTRRYPGQVIEPDPQLDDFSYRRLKQSDAANVPPPHPPFGIPLQPVQFNPINNYMHFRPEVNGQPPFRSGTDLRSYRKTSTADPQQDDLALRAWRKDLREPMAALSGSSAAATALNQSMEQSQNKINKVSPVNAENPYSNKLRCTNNSFFQQPQEPLTPVTTKNVADLYLQKCKQSLRPTRSFAADEISQTEANEAAASKPEVAKLKQSNSLDNSQIACRNASGGHVGGKFFTRIQQNLQAMDKENHAQLMSPVNSNSNHMVPKNRIYNRTGPMSCSSKTPSPPSLSQPTSLAASPTNLNANPTPSPPKGLLFRRPASQDTPPKHPSPNMGAHVTSRSTDDQLEQLLHNFNQVPNQINHKPIISNVWQNKSSLVADTGSDKSQADNEPSPCSSRLASACSWADNEINLKPQIPFFIRHPEEGGSTSAHIPADRQDRSDKDKVKDRDKDGHETQQEDTGADKPHDQDTNANHGDLHSPCNYGQRQNASPTPVRARTPSWLQSPSSPVDQSSTSEYLKFIPPTPLKSQVNEIKQLFESKSGCKQSNALPVKRNAIQSKIDLLQRANSLDNSVARQANSLRTMNTSTPSLESSMAANAPTGAIQFNPIGRNVMETARQFDCNRHLLKSQSQPSFEIRRQQAISKAIETPETPSDGHKTDDSSASTVRKRLQPKMAVPMEPIVSAGSPDNDHRRGPITNKTNRRKLVHAPCSTHRYSPRSKLLVKTGDDEEDESEHETSSSDEASSASSVLSGQSVFVAKNSRDNKHKLIPKLSAKHATQRRSNCGSKATKRRLAK